MSPQHQEVYAIPRPNPPLLKMATDPVISSHIPEDVDHDYVEPPLEPMSEDEEDPGYYRVPRTLQSSMSDTTCNRWNSSIYSPPPPPSNRSNDDPGKNRDSASSGGDLPIFPENKDVGYEIYSEVPEESHYEAQTIPAIYQNADDAKIEAETFKSSRSNSTELLNSTGHVENTSTPVSPATTSSPLPPPQGLFTNSEYTLVLFMYPYTPAL